MARRGRPPYPDVLTPREFEVLALLREELSNEEIAERLGVTLAGAKYHVSEILGKLGVSSREEAARWAPEERPRWAAARALVPALWLRRLVGASWTARAVAIGLAVAVAAGVALLVWGLLTTDGDETPGATFAYAAIDETIWLAASGGSAPQQLVSSPVGARNAAWSPSGRYLAYVPADGTLHLLDLETGVDPVLDDGTNGSLLYGTIPASAQMVWSPTADVLFYDTFESAQIGAASIGTRRVTPGSRPVEMEGSFGELSPDGRYFLYGVRTATEEPQWERADELYLANTDGSSVRRLTTGIPIYTAASPWSPDGRLLAYWKSDSGGTSTIGDIYIMDIESEREFSLGEFTSDERPQWSPETDRYVFYNLEIDPDAQTATPLFERPSVILGWSPDGSRVAYVEGPAFGGAPRSLAVLDVASGDRTVFHTSNAFTAHVLGSGYGGAWSPDSRYYAFVAFESAETGASALYVADTQSGEARQVLKDFDVGSVFLSYSPDGRDLVIQTEPNRAPAIWLADADGSNASKLVDGQMLQNGEPWRPAQD